MRISDWSSDVCSSDLFLAPFAVQRLQFGDRLALAWIVGGELRHPDEQTPGLQPFVLIAGAVARLTQADEHATRRLGARHRRFKRSGGDQHGLGVALGMGVGSASCSDNGGLEEEN